MSDKVYTRSVSRRNDGFVSLQYDTDDYWEEEYLHDIINTQNERITALEAQVAGLVAKSVNKFGEELL